MALAIGVEQGNVVLIASKSEEIRMMKRWILVASLTVLAGLGFAAPSQAGTVFVTSVDFASSNPALTDIDITYSGSTGTVSGLVVLPPSQPGVSISLIGSNEVQIALTPPSTGPINPINFELTASAAAYADVKVQSDTAVYVGGQSGISSIGYTLSPLTAPEPGSMALLGMGMTGFLVFRRFVKRCAAA